MTLHFMWLYQAYKFFLVKELNTTIKPRWRIKSQYLSTSYLNDKANGKSFMCTETWFHLHITGIFLMQTRITKRKLVHNKLSIFCRSFKKTVSMLGQKSFRYKIMNSIKILLCCCRNPTSFFFCRCSIKMHVKSVWGKQ